MALIFFSSKMVKNPQKRSHTVMKKNMYKKRCKTVKIGFKKTQVQTVNNNDKQTNKKQSKTVKNGQ